MSLINKKFSEAAKVLSDADDEVLQAAGMMAFMRLETLQRRLKGDNTGKKALTPLPPETISSQEAKPLQSVFENKGATLSGFTELLPKEEQKSLFDTKTTSTTPSLFPFNFGSKSQDKDTAKNIFSFQSPAKPLIPTTTGIVCAVKNTDLVNNEKKMSKSVDNALQMSPGKPQELKTPVKTETNFMSGSLFGPNPIKKSTENRIRTEISIQTEPTSPKTKDNADSVFSLPLAARSDSKVLEAVSQRVVNKNTSTMAQSSICSVDRQLLLEKRADRNVHLEKNTMNFIHSPTYQTFESKSWIFNCAREFQPQPFTFNNVVLNVQPFQPRQRSSSGFDIGYSPGVGGCGCRQIQCADRRCGCNKQGVSCGSSCLCSSRGGWCLNR